MILDDVEGDNVERMVAGAWCSFQTTSDFGNEFLNLGFILGERIKGEICDGIEDAGQND